MKKKYLGGFFRTKGVRGANFLFRNCLKHLSMKPDKCSFRTGVLRISVFSYNIHLDSSIGGSGNFLTKSLFLGLPSFKRMPSNIFFQIILPGFFLYLPNLPESTKIPG